MKSAKYFYSMTVKLVPCFPLIKSAVILAIIMGDKVDCIPMNVLFLMSLATQR